MTMAAGSATNAWHRPTGRGDEFAIGEGPDPRYKPKPVIVPRDMFVPDLHIDTLKVKSRNFH
ncbi:hypothetical protein GGE12_006897 [Rhizobium mongolense]|uniref:Uncharacterized protein n=1 Tax=Rhizobium mongolense TaxID=57676 RepID=A0A7W6RUX9_9HYPH|nr:hypothetical protein [Rhizobium mongolense]